MAGFTENAMAKKLLELNSSQQSIQTVSLWLIHHRKHHAAIVKTWFRELLNAKDSKQLTFMYLANDVIQNSKKKGPEYGNEFGVVLKKAFEHMAKTGINEKTKTNLHRILNIWQERGVYNAAQIREFKIAVDPNDPEFLPPVKKRQNSQSEVSDESDISIVKSPPQKKLRNGNPEDAKNDKTNNEVKVNSNGLSPSTPGEPPDPEDLIKVILELENSASSDATVREMIASLPPEVSESQYIGLKVKDKESAMELSETVNSAMTLLVDYNRRLAEELQMRKRLAVMLRDYLHFQQEKLTDSELKLEQYQAKLEFYMKIRAGVLHHRKSLPDETPSPDNVSDGALSPLPSPIELFNAH